MNCAVCQEKIKQPITICCQINLHPACAMILNQCQHCQQKYSPKLQQSLDSNVLILYDKYKETMIQREAKQKVARNSIRYNTAKAIMSLQDQRQSEDKSKAGTRDLIKISKCSFK